MTTGKLIARNAFVLLLSQVITNALAFVVVPLVARSLGSTDYGKLYVATVIATFAAMLVDCGQTAYVTIAVARDNGRATDFMVTSLFLKGAMGLVTALGLECLLRILGYDSTTRLLAFLLFLSLLFGLFATTAMSVVNGLERMGRPALANVITKVVYTGLMVLAIWSGARLRGVAAVEIAAAFFGLLISFRWVSRMKLLAARPRWDTARNLLVGGLPFVLWTSINAFQPSLEGVLMSKYASAEAVGWFGVTVKLTTLLLFPAVILSSALNPTAARLHATDAEGFRRTVRESVRLSILLGVPFAVGAWVFAAPGIALVFGNKAFGPSADILRVFSLYLAPVFLNIGLGGVLVVTNRQLRWTFCKGATVALGALASIVVIPWFQTRYGNGGLGAAAVTVMTELTMLACALSLLPRGILEGRTLLDLGRALVAGAAFAGTARLLSSVPFLLALPCCLVAYVAALFAVRALGAREVGMVRHTLRGALGGS